MLFGEISESDAWAAYQRGEISIASYSEIKDKIKQQETQQAELHFREKSAQEIERLIISFGGVKTNRNHGQIPNPFGGGSKNLTNQAVIVGQCKRGNREAIELAKYLHQEAGLVSPDYLGAIVDGQIAREQSHQRMMEVTHQTRQANQSNASTRPANGALGGGSVSSVRW